MAQESASDSEIRALIARLGDSSCRFQRNGRWYDAAAAQAHLQRKYDWARKRGMSGDAESFIAQAATRSSFSGRAYRVDCPGQAQAEAAPWFTAQLAELRTSAPPR
ncbi:DUF5329 family protein [Pseudoxanthomonas daejeonensis]|uniref:Uncharacterized protein n=1 Tax=Pseudoxanthomonas daejeonensis TaxID=266062 RepID=A0ABQ6Z558_9GAMM|nr:DUF5329 domain-containing protein [Pseudoxanthomonas daejeonensis]KAF1693213.1 hypothetical protein CSC65_12260 [Pseudoxanthomonas daejeonensis]